MERQDHDGDCRQVYRFEQCFIDSLPEEAFRNELARIKGKECIIGVGQHYDLFIGSHKLRDNPNMKPLVGSVEYEAQGNSYRSDIFVDLVHYMTFYSSTSDEEKLLKSLKTISDELHDIRRSISAHNEQAKGLEPNEDAQ